MIKYITLPSGGFNLIKYLGVMEPLYKNNTLDFDVIEGYYGISAGGILSSVLCLNLEFETIVKYFVERTWHKTYNVNKINIINYFNEKGIFNKGHFVKLIEPLFKSCNYDLSTLTMKEFYNKTNKKLTIFAINASNYELMPFNHETTPDILLLDALYFTSCIPGIFKPEEYNGICYLDGGLCSKTPIDYCIDVDGVDKNEVFAIDCYWDFYKTVPISKNDDFVSFLYNIMLKIYINNVSKITNLDAPYLMHMKTIQYSESSLNDIWSSKESRQCIYLDGIQQGNAFLETLKFDGVIDNDEEVNNGD
jgi:predicted acylesterase/phospholipase RssA